MRNPKQSINVRDHILPDGSMPSELRGLLERALKEMEAHTVDQRQPPWKAFPEYDRYSMGWRMGSGEDYWVAFHSWIRSLSNQDVDAFIASHPEPENWSGFYDGIFVDG